MGEPVAAVRRSFQHRHVIQLPGLAIPDHGIRITTIFRMAAVTATLPGLPRCLNCRWSHGVPADGGQRWHVQQGAPCGHGWTVSRADCQSRWTGAPGPSGLACAERTQFGRLHQQPDGGRAGDARNRHRRFRDSSAVATSRSSSWTRPICRLARAMSFSNGAGAAAFQHGQRLCHRVTPGTNYPDPSPAGYALASPSGRPPSLGPS